MGITFVRFLDQRVSPYFLRLQMKTRVDHERIAQACAAASE